MEHPFARRIVTEHRDAPGGAARSQRAAVERFEDDHIDRSEKILAGHESSVASVSYRPYPTLGTASNAREFRARVQMSHGRASDRRESRHRAGQIKKEGIVSNYVLSFRGRSDRASDPAQEAAWGRWFGEIGASIVDFGNRVGRATTLGEAATNTVLTGYLLIQADSYDAALAVAKGCPGLAQGGAVEVGETVPSA
jgi:hypothetical protein